MWLLCCVNIRILFSSTIIISRDTSCSWNPNKEVYLIIIKELKDRKEAKMLQKDTGFRYTDVYVIIAAAITKLWCCTLGYFQTMVHENMFSCMNINIGPFRPFRNITPRAAQRVNLSNEMFYSDVPLKCIRV